MLLARKVLTGVSLAVLTAFGAMLLLALLVPIYTDEIGSRMQLTRVFVEGGRMISLLPQCRSSWSIPIPAGWYPGAIYYLLFLPLGLLGDKIVAIAFAFAWFGAVGFAIARTTKDTGSRIRRLASFVALHAFGTVPFALVTARAEPTLVFILGAYVVFPLAWPIRSRRTRWGRALVAAAFVFLTSIFFFSHGKALFFSPFVLLSLLLTVGWRRPGWLAVTGTLVVTIVLQTHGRARASTSCAEAPIVDSTLKLVGADPGLAFRDPTAFLKSGATNLRNRTRDTAETMLLQPKHHWLPPPASTTTIDGERRADALSRVFLLGIVTLLPVSLVIVGLRASRRPAARKPLALVAALLACLGAHLWFSSHWNFYSSPFVIGVIAIASAIVATVAAGALPERTRRAAGPLALGAALVLQLAALASMVATIVFVTPRLSAAARVEGSILPGQPAYVRALGASLERPKIRAHAQACGIEGDGARHLVIDDATLFAFDGLREPLHLIYVTDAAMWGYDFPGDKDVAFLRSLGATGIISRCSYFPTALVAKAKEKDGYCCVGPSDLK